MLVGEGRRRWRIRAADDRARAGACARHGTRTHARARARPRAPATSPPARTQPRRRHPQPPPAGRDDDLLAQPVRPRARGRPDPLDQRAADPARLDRRRAPGLRVRAGRRLRARDGAGDGRDRAGARPRPRSARSRRRRLAARPCEQLRPARRGVPRLRRSASTSRSRRSPARRRCNAGGAPVRARPLGRMPECLRDNPLLGSAAHARPDRSRPRHRLRDAARATPTSASVRRLEESISIKTGRVEGVASGESEGFGVRVLVDGAWGFASSHVLTTAEADRVAAEAVRIARASATALRDQTRLDDRPPAHGTLRDAARGGPVRGPARDQDRRPARRRPGGRAGQGHRLHRVELRGPARVEDLRRDRRQPDRAGHHPRRRRGRGQRRRRRRAPAPELPGLGRRLGRRRLRDHPRARPGRARRAAGRRGRRAADRARSARPAGSRSSSTRASSTSRSTSRAATRPSSTASSGPRRRTPARAS